LSPKSDQPEFGDPTMNQELGQRPPDILVTPPGPESRRLARELAAYECRNVTYLADDFPVFWAEARGSNVRDADGNVYVDLTAAFAVAAAGHAHPAIVAAVREQAGRLLHGMGDVHPPEIKVKLLRKLAEIAPGALGRTILAGSGAEAVEAALKTVALATGRPRVLAFSGSYHGLTLGALSVSGRRDFRVPFERQLGPNAVFASYPDSYRSGRDPGAQLNASVDEIERILDAEEGTVGAVLAEPVQGRGGDIVPPAGWLGTLRRICDERGLLLVLDEVYTGFGRTGRWFACDHEGVVPDLLVVGKALTGGLPFAACIGTEEAMSAWPVSAGEALHTSTFLGHPLGCAAALASLDVIAREDLVGRSAAEGRYLREHLQARVGAHPRVGEVRGLGLMIGVELVRDRMSREPAPELVGRVLVEALRRGYLLLGGGLYSNVLSFSPPLAIDRGLLNGAVEALEEILARLD
jgi:4-aminobutyrate aminotransferase / (S)-3-amino-2-methylpropionate transaminase / 5-aminovalerate transaminase